MQLIGFLGGMSWESTAEYYRLANELVREPPRRPALGALRDVLRRLRGHRAHAGRGALGGRGRRAGRRRPVAGGLRRGLPGPVHEHDAQGRGRPREEVDLPLLHIGDTTAAAIAAAGVRRVGLLGTGFTMAQPFYADRLRSAGLDVWCRRRRTRRSCTGSSTTSCASA